MFLNHIKEFITKKIVKNSLSNVNNSSSDILIKKVGIIFDETYFYEKSDLIKELTKNGIKEEDCSVLVFKNRLKKNTVYDYPHFTYKNLDWNGHISKKEVKDFINQPFDLLINYYDTEKAALMAVSSQSKSNFKVGFSTVDKRLNHFMITTNAENYKVFIEELFKYLKILNKI
ncbi:DUF6913 domain-containing protein [Flavobacterium capsici]|uniref:Uncharacterized protein n=1 Tax=Flavobacterium capsici TaxID=3075618 RepID=A0AA96EWR5_9FLAO|nr:MULTISPECIES: hypothetical protein [unclassified Flavobacterium]WNM18317.1 hypothetical protein RN608_09855 [Flavobacterium sp. PMR2A8]WNM22368.1 hypothetical protein RN605_03155 [Flavobacterium sp. PMTSA4]